MYTYTEKQKTLVYKMLKWALHGFKSSSVEHSKKIWNEWISFLAKQSVATSYNKESRRLLNEIRELYIQSTKVRYKRN